MHTYALYVEDDRYSVPTLVLLIASESRAKARAAELLADSPHHRSVEVHLNGVTVHSVSKAEREQRSAASQQYQSPS